MFSIFSHSTCKRNNSRPKQFEANGRSPVSEDVRKRKVIVSHQKKLYLLYFIIVTTIITAHLPSRVFSERHDVMFITALNSGDTHFETIYPDRPFIMIFLIYF